MDLHIAFIVPSCKSCKITLSHLTISFSGIQVIYMMYFMVHEIRLIESAIQLGRKHQKCPTNICNPQRK